MTLGMVRYHAADRSAANAHPAIAYKKVPMSQPHAERSIRTTSDLHGSIAEPELMRQIRCPEREFGRTETRMKASRVRYLHWS